MVGGEFEGAHALHASTRRGSSRRLAVMACSSSRSVSSALASAALWCIRARSRASSLAESWNRRIERSMARPPEVRAHTRAERRPLIVDSICTSLGDSQPASAYSLRWRPIRRPSRRRAQTTSTTKRDEDRHLDDEVDRQQPGPAGDGREVPDRVRQHGQEVAADRCEHLERAVAGRGGDADADPGEDREHRVGERREQAAGDERAGEGRVAAVAVGHAEVLDVLGEREARRDHARVDHPVDDPVELAAPEPPDRAARAGPCRPPRPGARRRPRWRAGRRRHGRWPPGRRCWRRC